MASSFNPDGSPRDLHQFLDQGGQIWLVQDLGSGKLAGVAYRNPGVWSWTELPLEGPGAKLFRETGLSLINQAIRQAIPGLTPLSSLDQALNIATSVLSPQAIAGKLANAVGQAVAHHLGLSPIAPAVGKVTEQAVSSLTIPADVPDRALGAARVAVVTYDLHGGELTPAVTDFIMDKFTDKINDLMPHVSRPEIRAIQDALEQPQPDVTQPPKPTPVPPPPAPPPPHPGHHLGPPSEL